MPMKIKEFKIVYYISISRSNERLIANSTNVLSIKFLKICVFLFLDTNSNNFAHGHRKNICKGDQKAVKRSIKFKTRNLPSLLFAFSHHSSLQFLQDDNSK